MKFRFPLGNVHATSSFDTVWRLTCVRAEYCAESALPRYALHPVWDCTGCVPEPRDCAGGVTRAATVMATERETTTVEVRMRLLGLGCGRAAESANVSARAALRPECSRVRTDAPGRSERRRGGIHRCGASWRRRGRHAVR